METTIEVFGQTIKTKAYVIHIDRTKFTEEEMIALEEYRQLAIRLKIISRHIEKRMIDSKTKQERKEWEKCCDLIDEITCVYDGRLFDEFPQLPDQAVHVFY